MDTLLILRTEFLPSVAKTMTAIDMVKVVINQEEPSSACVALAGSTNDGTAVIKINEMSEFQVVVDTVLCVKANHDTPPWLGSFLGVILRPLASE